MNEAAQQAADGMSRAEIDHALVMLDLVWGDEFKFGHDAEKGFWATPHGKMMLFTADGPDELGEKLAAQAGAAS